MAAPAPAPSEIRDSLLKWIVLALLVMSGLDLKPAAAFDPPAAPHAAIDPATTHR